MRQGKPDESLVSLLGDVSVGRGPAADAASAALGSGLRAVDLQACGQTLVRAGDLARAEIVFAALARSHPETPAGAVGLAEVSVALADWSRALLAWESLVTAFPDHANLPYWQSQVAHALMEMGRSAQAESLLRELIAKSPEALRYVHTLGALLFRSGRWEEALATTVAYATVNTAPAHQATLARLRLEILGRRAPEIGRAEFAGLMARPPSADMLTVLFELTPALFEKAERTAIWSELLAKAVDCDDCGVLRLRTRLALRDDEGFLRDMHQADPGAPYRRLLDRTADILAGAPSSSRPKVFVIGLSKTGTTSLAQALGTLGWQVADWRNPLTMELVTEDDFGVFDAGVDTPVSVRFEALRHRFPNAKFVYTVREKEAWVDALLRHLRRNVGATSWEEMRTAAPAYYGRELHSIHQELYFRYADPAEAWTAWDRRVRSSFQNAPKSRFLVFDVFAGHGWPELCRFLRVRAPKHPFPWTNRDPTMGAPA